jgi:dihydrofolate reductase
VDLEISLDGYLVGDAAPAGEVGDELLVRVVPVLLGRGRPAFEDVAALELSLESATLLDDGRVELRYRPKGLVGREPV